MRIEDVIEGGIYRRDHLYSTLRSVHFKVTKVSKGTGKRTRIYAHVINENGSRPEGGTVFEVPHFDILDNVYRWPGWEPAEDEFTYWVRGVRKKCASK